MEQQVIHVIIEKTIAWEPFVAAGLTGVIALFIWWWNEWGKRIEFEVQKLEEYFDLMNSDLIYMEKHLSNVIAVLDGADYNLIKPAYERSKLNENKLGIIHTAYFFDDVFDLFVEYGYFTKIIGKTQRDFVKMLDSGNHQSVYLEEINDFQSEIWQFMLQVQHHLTKEIQSRRSREMRLPFTIRIFFLKISSFLRPNPILEKHLDRIFNDALK